VKNEHFVVRDKDGNKEALSFDLIIAETFAAQYSNDKTLTVTQEYNERIENGTIRSTIRRTICKYKDGYRVPK